MEEANIDFMVEWAVWSHLDRMKELELILLKGHLLLEGILVTALARFELQNADEFSFFRKVHEFEKCLLHIDDSRGEPLILLLRKLNKLRNELAHQFLYKVENGSLEAWAAEVRNSLEGEKYCSFTFRTKIVHAFSILSRNILDVSTTGNRPDSNLNKN